MKEGIKALNSDPNLFSLFEKIHGSELFGTIEKHTSDLVYNNKNLNESQKEAVQAIVNNTDLLVVHGPPGTGKTTVGLKMADILFQLGYIQKGHLLTVTRDDLVGQYIGHTAPKTKEVLKKAMGGVLFIDEAYYLYKPDNERDYGSEAIEILLQVMENQRDDLVVILAGYKEPMDKFYESNPGLSSRIANHIDFPDYSIEELLRIAKMMLEDQQYQLTSEAEVALREYIKKRKDKPLFANARSVKNALDRARMRQANRIFESRGKILTKKELVNIEASDILQSTIFD